MGLEYTPVYNKKKPNEINEAKRKYLFDEDEWQDISDTVETSVKTVAERICRGEFPAIPDTEGAGYSPCVYCEFKPICRKAEI